MYGMLPVQRLSKAKSNFMTSVNMKLIETEAGRQEGWEREGEGGNRVRKGGEGEKGKGTEGGEEEREGRGR